MQCEDNLQRSHNTSQTLGTLKFVYTSMHPLEKRSVALSMTRLTQTKRTDAWYEMCNELKTYEARGSAKERTCMVVNDDYICGT